MPHPLRRSRACRLLIALLAVLGIDLWVLVVLTRGTRIEIAASADAPQLAPGPFAEGVRTRGNPAAPLILRPTHARYAT